MKNIIAFLLVLFVSQLNAQDGLEQIIIERYYISNIDDAALNDVGGELPDSSVTYRVFIDMLPDYIFQAVYATSGLNANELVLGTTTKFFNNEDRGEKFATIKRSRLGENTVMLDSWLSVGAACEDCIGVEKENDDGVDNIENEDSILQNNTEFIGIPLTEQDGHINGSPEAVTIVGFTTELDMFDNTNDVPAPNEIRTNNGSWASLNGSRGADAAENKVLIGQFTTNGTFYFELNVQIRNEMTGEVERYVSRDPDAADGEFSHPDLIQRDSIPVDSMVSTIDELVEAVAQQIQTYPNPVSNYVSVKIKNGLNWNQAKYVFRTSVGQIIKSGELNARFTKIPLTEIDNGLYFLTIHIDDVAFTQRILKIAD